MKNTKKENIEERKKTSKARRRREETARKAGMKVLRGEKREA